MKKSDGCFFSPFLVILALFLAGLWPVAANAEPATQAVTGTQQEYDGLVDVPPTVQVLIYSESLQDRLKIDQDLQNFADLQEAKIRATNTWHKPLSIRYKTIWYTKDGAEITEEDNVWHNISILPNATHEWDAIAPEDGYDAIVHIK